VAFRATIESFLENCREPALLEPGEEMLPLAGGNYALEVRGSRLTLPAWDRTRNWTRRIIDIADATNARLDMTVERFARREGQMFLLDLGRRGGVELGRRAGAWCSASASGCSCAGSFRSGTWRRSACRRTWSSACRRRFRART